jgi:hypothetical protein
MASPKYKLNKEDGLKILTVLGWTLGSALVAFVIDLVPQVELGAHYAWLVPMINTGLVALQKWIKDHS